jgi:hypothetical protein
MSGGRACSRDGALIDGTIGEPSQLIITVDFDFTGVKAISMSDYEERAYEAR